MSVSSKGVRVYVALSKHSLDIIQAEADKKGKSTALFLAELILIGYQQKTK